ncbi:MAG: winged helix-turn-helix transcriptional regulator, partial [Acidobacteria bacterium]|nr:winged helix-turn-helix transcriptional regulator [Acidobacteriota bacterium]
MVQYSPPLLDSTFAALSDPTRRGILEYLGRTDASISDLAANFDI